jgi:hypothetical protein
MKLWNTRIQSWQNQQEKKENPQGYRFQTPFALINSINRYKVIVGEMGFQNSAEPTWLTFTTGVHSTATGHTFPSSAHILQVLINLEKQKLTPEYSLTTR